MSEKNLRIGLIITAAGVGRRLGAGINKTLLKIEDKTILEIALSSFIQFKEIKKIVISYHGRDHSSYQEIVDKICKREGIKKEKIQLIEGGKERSNSVLNCLKVLGDNFDFIMIHDAARPFFPHELFDSFLNEMKKYEAIVPYLPCEDTMLFDLQKNLDGRLLLGREEIERPDRNRLLKIQTPQCFSKRLAEIIRQAIEESPVGYTDESSALLESGEMIKFIKGSKYLNKITDREDYEIARRIYRAFWDGESCSSKK